MSITDQQSSVECLSATGKHGDILKIIPQKRKPTEPFSASASSALQAVKAFLPKLALANDELQKKINAESAEAVNIENVDNCNSPHIQMDIAIFEDENETDSSSDSESDSDTPESDANDDSVAVCNVSASINESNIKMPSEIAKRKCRIEELN